MAIVGNKTNKTFFPCYWRCFLLLPCGCGLMPVDDRLRFTMRTQNVLIVMKYKQARLPPSLSLSFVHKLFLSLLIQFSVVTITRISLHILSFQCEISFIGLVYADSHTSHLSPKSLLSFSFSFSLLFLCSSFLCIYNLLNFFFLLQRLNFINSNKTDKIKINGISWRNDKRKKRGKK